MCQQVAPYQLLNVAFVGHDGHTSLGQGLLACLQAFACVLEVLASCALPTDSAWSGPHGQAHQSLK
jgi:hypothetical protein